MFQLCVKLKPGFFSFLRRILTMLNFSDIGSYKENNRIEAKKAQGGLPESIWETYSAFANTLGGIILLGVVEKEDKTFEAVGVSHPEKLVKQIWDILNNQNKVSVNLLSHKDMFVQEINGKKIIVINVPRADRAYRPVYIDGNPLNSYRRDGEGDYRCTKEQYQSMVRDSSVRTQDMLIMEEMGIDTLNPESIRSYRQRMRISKPGHVWEALEDEDFLLRIGAAAIGTDGKKHPTSAGLLFFGNEFDIVKEFNNYFLDYQERDDTDIRWSDRIISSSGDWSGNIYDFYFKVYNRIAQDIKSPFSMEGISRVDDTPVHQALREALANCLVNADYYGRQGVVIIKERDMISFSNPGNFRIEIDAARSGGISDPRNAVILKLFNLINIGERSGSGIPSIFSVWRQEGYDEPEIVEMFEPERIKLQLKFTKIGDKKSAIKIGDKKSAIKDETKKRIIEYLTDHAAAKSSEIGESIGLKSSRVRDYLNMLIKEDIVVAEGSNRNRIYRLR